MARARSLKPGFFFNVELAELDPLVRLLFAGTWTIADREGRLKDQPLRIKAETLPYDDIDVDHALDQLQEKGFVTRYQVNGCKFIQIQNWNKHQNPHVKERESEIQEPDKHRAKTRKAPDKNSTSMEEASPRARVSDSLNPEPCNGLPVTDKKPKKSSFVGTEPFRLAKLLSDLIRQNHPATQEPNLEAWAADIDRMIRIDKRNPKQIEAVIRWCQADHFWNANILSAATLRKKKEGVSTFDKLIARMENDTKKNPSKGCEIEKDPAFSQLGRSAYNLSALQQCGCQACRKYMGGEDEGNGFNAGDEKLATF